MAVNKIPVVDFSAYNNIRVKCNEVLNPEINKLAQEIYDAFTTVGFVYIKNHGIPESEISEIFQVSEKFFKLSSEEKNKYARAKPATTNHGYVAAGVETVDPNEPSDFKEAFDICEVLNDDISWPDEQCSDFKPNVRSFFNTCGKLTHRILDLIALGLQLEDKKLFQKTHAKFGTSGNQTTIRLLYYPVMTDLQKGQVRLAEHTDYGTITLLFQDQVGGLEVFSQTEGFVPARPIEGTILVNIGDLLQRWTHNKLVSTKHRVVVPREQLRCLTPRQSMAFFVNPDDEVIIECLDGSGHYPPISSLDYLNQRLNATYL